MRCHNPCAMEIIWQADLLPSSPHFTISMVLSYQPHTLGYLLILWNMFESQSENNEPETCRREMFCKRVRLPRRERSARIWSVLLWILYLQNLHARLRSGRCLAGYPPNLCVQPEKVSLQGVNVRGADSDRSSREDSPGSSVPVVPVASSWLLSVLPCWFGRHHWCQTGDRNKGTRTTIVSIITEHRQDRPSLVSFLTSLNASLSSFTPIMSAVSASSLGPMSSTKSSKSTCPPTVGPTDRVWLIDCCICASAAVSALCVQVERLTHGSCWSAGSVRSAPSLLACSPSSSCSSPSLYSLWSRLCPCQTPWMPPAALRARQRNRGGYEFITWEHWEYFLLLFSPDVSHTIHFFWPQLSVLWRITVHS